MKAKQERKAHTQADQPVWDVVFLLLPNSLILDWAGPA